MFLKIINFTHKTFFMSTNIYHYCVKVWLNGVVCRRSSWKYDIFWQQTDYLDIDIIYSSILEKEQSTIITMTILFDEDHFRRLKTGKSKHRRQIISSSFIQDIDKPTKATNKIKGRSKWVIFTMLIRRLFPSS